MNQKVYQVSEKFIRISIIRRTATFRALRGKELFKGQFPIMKMICENEGCTQKFLADRLLVTPASVALSLKRLAKAGLIKKSADASNLRCNRIYSTDKGRAITQESLKIHEQLDHRTFRGFTEEEMEILNGFFTRIVENLQDETNTEPIFEYADSSAGLPEQE